MKSVSFNLVSISGVEIKGGGGQDLYHQYSKWFCQMFTETNFNVMGGLKIYTILYSLMHF